MSATVAAYEAVFKQVWTSDRLEKQFISGDPILDQIERTSRYTIGKEAKVPLAVGRSGGYSVKPASGGALNGADQQKVDDATYNYTHHYFQVEIESAAIDQSDGGNAKTAASVVDTEVTGAVDDLRHQVARQAVGNGDALIAQCATTTASATVALSGSGYGADAIRAGWLYPGLKVDIGTTGNETAVVGDAVIQSVNDDEANNYANPTITIDSSVTTSSSHFVSIANARTGTTSYEANGLRLIFGSTAPLGGINPATAGEEFWKPAFIDTTTTSLTLDTMYAGNRKIMQRTRESADWVLTSLKVQEDFYKLLQMQTRFNGDQNLGAGNVGGVQFAGMKIDAVPDLPNREMYFLKKKHLFVVATDKPHWQNKYTGGNILDWRQGYTSATATLMYRFNLGTNRRNAGGAYLNLTA